MLSITVAKVAIMLKRPQAIVAAIVCLIIVAIVISAAFFASHIHPVGTPLLHLLVQGNFTVDANSYKAYNFTTPNEISQCQVSGSFSVSGANPSKIRVYIWDNAEFTNWQRGHISQFQSPFGQIISFYDSGLASNGIIEATPYPGGTYFLIYHNNSTEPQNITSQATFWYMPT
jgi:hypothetical protein